MSSRRLRMTAEIGDWLTDLGGSESARAAEVGAALIAVLQAADPAGLAILSEPTTPRPPDLRERADHAYRQRLEELQHIRRSVADAATDRRRTELLLEERRRAGAGVEQISEAEHDLVEARLREEQLAQLSQRLQGEVDAVRTAKETAKAVYTAAEARLRIAEALEAVGGEPDADLAQLREELRVAELKLQAVESGVTMEVIRHRAARAGTAHPAAAERHGSLQAPSGAEHPQPPPAPPAPGKPAPGLLELRGDPLGSDIRILLAVEPTDTVTLLAILEGPEAVAEHGARAVRLASDLLIEIRGDGWPADIDEVAFADGDAFLARFFPADEGSISRRAGLLAQARPLSVMRGDQHMSIDELAARSGLDADRVAAIERQGLRTARVHEAVALARALDARLELPASSGPILGD